MLEPIVEQVTRGSGLKLSRKCLVMELVEGKSLRAVLDFARRLTVDRALDVAREIAAALVYLRANGVVHRYLKPENVVVTSDGTVKLLDFGSRRGISVSYAATGFTVSWTTRKSGAEASSPRWHPPAVG